MSKIMKKQTSTGVTEEKCTTLYNPRLSDKTYKIGERYLFIRDNTRSNTMMYEEMKNRIKKGGNSSYSKEGLTEELPIYSNGITEDNSPLLGLTEDIAKHSNSITEDNKSHSVGLTEDISIHNDSITEDNIISNSDEYIERTSTAIFPHLYLSCGKIVEIYNEKLGVEFNDGYLIYKTNYTPTDGIMDLAMNHLCKDSKGSFSIKGQRTIINGITEDEL